MTDGNYVSVWLFIHWYRIHLHVPIARFGPELFRPQKGSSKWEVANEQLVTVRLQPRTVKLMSSRISYRNHHQWSYDCLALHILFLTVSIQGLPHSICLVFKPSIDTTATFFLISSSHFEMSSCSGFSHTRNCRIHQSQQFRPLQDVRDVAIMVS